MGVNFEGFAVLYDGIIIKPLPPSLNHITCHMKEKGEMTVLAATLSFPQTTTGGKKFFLSGFCILLHGVAINCVLLPERRGLEVQKRLFCLFFFL